MVATAILALSAALPMALAQTLSNETVLGVYMFHRHGDRTSKALAPANLTDLGYLEVFQSGEYYRSRYIDSNAPYRISGINTDLILQSQIQASAPDDDVLQNSAQGFLQGLYPPVGSPMNQETLANGSTISAPMNGYQLIPVELVESGTGSESNSWLQSTTSCYNAELSSNEYFDSPQYTTLLNSTAGFYKTLLPALEPVFNSSTATFKNAYTIWDYINVGEIHNTSLPSVLTPSVLFQMQGLAFVHEWNLAYNSSAPIRAIAGKQLGAQIVQFLNSTIDSAGKQSGQKFGVQFGSYGSFSSFFGLADLQSVNIDFTGVANYASSMSFEMFTNSSTAVTEANYPGQDEIYVRFLFKNGTASDASPPQVYPLFGTGQDAMSWKDFESRMSAFSIFDTPTWCTACGNSTGICEGLGPGSSSDSGSSGSSSSSSSSSGGNGNGLSPAVNGVIGAMVTLAVVLGLEALLMVALGLRIVSKKRVASASGNDGAKA